MAPERWRARKYCEPESKGVIIMKNSANNYDAEIVVYVWVCVCICLTGMYDKYRKKCKQIVVVLLSYAALHLKKL